MKTTTCSQLGGPSTYSVKFIANSFEEIAKMSKKHGIKMFQKGDNNHLSAMKKMQKNMQNPKFMQNWFENKRKELESLPEDM